MSIPRGVTPTFTLTFDSDDLDLTQADHVYVTFANKATITKSDADLDIRAKQISVYLTQEETLSFKEGATAIQVNWTYGDGSRAASEIVRYTFNAQLLNRVVE